MFSVKTVFLLLVFVSFSIYDGHDCDRVFEGGEYVPEKLPDIILGCEVPGIAPSSRL